MPLVRATSIPDFICLPMKFCKGNFSFRLLGSAYTAVQEWHKNTARHQILIA